MELYWAFWVIGIAVTFGIAEAYALVKGKQTLSRTVWDFSRAFPPLPWVAGVLVGFLASHFWWGGAYCFQNTPGLN